MQPYNSLREPLRHSTAERSYLKGRSESFKPTPTYQ